MTTSAYAPVKGKCIWWREAMMDEDRYASRLKDEQRRMSCSCFVEGKGWTIEAGVLPMDCPDTRNCRYYIRHW